MKIEIQEPESAFEAGALIFAGAFYLLMGKKDKRSWALIGWSVLTTLWFTVGKPAMENYMTERVKIEVAQPYQGPTSSLFFGDVAYAGGPQGPPIMHNGQLWGYADTTYAAFKLEGKDAIIIFEKASREPPLIFTPEGLSKYKSYRQSK
jgi:hypothetical protein